MSPPSRDSLNGVNSVASGGISVLGETLLGGVARGGEGECARARAGAVEAEVDGGAAALVRTDAGAGQVLARHQHALLDHDGRDQPDGDDHARYIEADIAAPGGKIRVASIYLPNGNPAPGPKFDYKLAWFERLLADEGIREDTTYEGVSKIRPAIPGGVISAAKDSTKGKF